MSDWRSSILFDLRVNPCNLQHVKEAKEEVSQSEVIDNANNTETKENSEQTLKSWCDTFRKK